MENGNLLKDDFLRKIFQNYPLDQASDGFVDGILEKIRLYPEITKAKKSFFQKIRSAIPYLVVSFFVLFIFLTSDLPIFSRFPGKEYWTGLIIPYYEILFKGIRDVFSSKYVSFGLLITFSVFFLYFIEILISKRPGVRNHTMI